MMDLDDFPDYIESSDEEGANIDNGLQCQYDNLLRITGRPPKACAKQEKIRVTRAEPPGYASRVAQFFENFLSEVNAVHSLKLFPLTLRAVLERMDEGKPILAACQSETEAKVLAQAALAIAANAGRACRGTALGIIASAGDGSTTIPGRRVAELTGASTTHVNRHKRQVEGGDFGTLASMSKVPKVVRVAFPDMEKDATKLWMEEENPSRSGDTKLIFWMSKSKEDFYYDVLELHRPHQGCRAGAHRLLFRRKNQERSAWRQKGWQDRDLLHGRTT